MHYMAAPELHFERLILQGLESHLQGAESLPVRRWMD